MKEIQILIKDHGMSPNPLWVTGYKVTRENLSKFIANFSSDRGEAAYFDDDDYIIDLCQNRFKEVELFEFDLGDSEQEQIIPLGIS